ncbi:hypothetical protein FQZ97_457860 [compost metagenome]
MQRTRCSIYRFWGLLDLFYVIRFVWLNLAQGRIPLYDDVLDASQLGEHGPMAMALICLGVALNLSISVSAVLLLAMHRLAFVLCLVQTPFRLLLVVPSLSVIPLLLGVMDLRSAMLSAALLLLSEGLKVSSLLLARRTVSA